jgi:hypothetical protein
MLDRMALFLSSVQCLAIGLFIFGLFGFLQGWRHGLVFMGFTLVAVLFLYIGGANGIAQIFFVRIPQTINVLTGGAVGPSSPPPPSATEVLISALIMLGVAMLLGFLVGNRAFPSKPGSVSTADHFLGIIPGLVAGYAVVSYVSHLFASNPSVSVGVTTPSPSALGSYIVILVIIAIVVLVIGLVTARFGRK